MESLTNRVGIEEPAGGPDDALKHLVVERHRGLHAEDKEVDRPDHGGDTEGAHNGPVDAEVEVMLIQRLLVSLLLQGEVAVAVGVTDGQVGL